MSDWLKRKLRAWLEVPAQVVVPDIEPDVERFRGEIAEIRSFSEQMVQRLQSQIDILNRVNKPAETQPVEQPIQVAGGFKTFTQRRREYTSKWSKPAAPSNLRQTAKATPDGAEP